MAFICKENIQYNGRVTFFFFLHNGRALTNECFIIVKTLICNLMSSKNNRKNFHL